MWLKRPYLPAVTIDRVINRVSVLISSRLEVRGLFSVLPASWQPALKPQPRSAPAEKVPGNTTALIADCLWINTLM